MCMHHQAEPLQSLVPLTAAQLFGLTVQLVDEAGVAVSALLVGRSRWIGVCLGDTDAVHGVLSLLLSWLRSSWW